MGAAASYEYGAGGVDILDELLPQNLAVQTFRALQGIDASFYGSE